MGKKSETSDSQELFAFVAMCFDGRLQHVYQKVVKPSLENHGFACIRADEIVGIGAIIDQIRKAIKGASLVLCDLTFENPNVFYELGIAHNLDKQVIMISQNAANIPFDVRDLRVIPYEDTKIGLLDLRDELAKFLTGIFGVGRESIQIPFVDELEIQRAALFSISLDFKRYAIKFLGDYRDVASFDRIKMLATDDANTDIRRDAFTSLHKIDPEKARPLLLTVGLREQKEDLVRERVVALLGNYRPPDKELLDQLIVQLGDTSWGVRRTICEVLGRLGKKRASGPLKKMLADSEPEVRLAASEALCRLSEPESIQGQFADLKAHVG